MFALSAAVLFVWVILVLALSTIGFRIRPAIQARHRMVGFVFAAGHLLIVAWITNLILHSGEPDWSMYWVLMWGLDFPASILYFAIGAFLPHFPDVALVHNAASPLNDLNNFLVPLIFTSVIGTAWWYFIPRLLVRVSKLIRR